MRASPQHIYMHENDQLHAQTNLTPWKQLVVSFKWLRPTPIWRQWCLPSHRSLPSWFLQKRISKNCICVCALFLVGFCRLPQPQKSFRKCKVRGNKETKKVGEGFCIKAISPLGRIMLCSSAKCKSYILSYFIGVVVDVVTRYVLDVSSLTPFSMFLVSLVTTDMHFLKASNRRAKYFHKPLR